MSDDGSAPSPPEKPPEMELGNKTAILGIAIGVFVALAGVAMPLAFDVTPFVWRSVFFVGVVISAALSTRLIFEHFARRHPDPSGVGTLCALAPRPVMNIVWTPLESFALITHVVETSPV